MARDSLGVNAARGPDDEELVRRFAHCRDGGDRSAAKAAWEQIVVANFDRVERWETGRWSERMYDEVPTAVGVATGRGAVTVRIPAAATL